MKKMIAFLCNCIWIYDQIPHRRISSLRENKFDVIIFLNVTILTTKGDVCVPASFVYAVKSCLLADSG